MRHAIVLCLVLAGGLVVQPVGASVPASAATPTLVAQQDNGAASDRRLSRKEAARRAKERHGGRVLSVEPANGGWRVRLLKDGQVRTVVVR